MTSSGSEQWNLVEREWRTKQFVKISMLVLHWHGVSQKMFQEEIWCPKELQTNTKSWGPEKYISEGRCMGEITILILRLLYWASHSSAVCSSWLLWSQSPYSSMLEKGWSTRIDIYLISNNLLGEILLCISSSCLALTSKDGILSPFSIKMLSSFLSQIHIALNHCINLIVIWLYISFMCLKSFFLFFFIIIAGSCSLCNHFISMEIPFDLWDTFTNSPFPFP